MQFLLLRDDSGLQKAQQRLPLLYTDCLPDVSDDSHVHAVIGDQQNTFLMVMRQGLSDETLQITAIVVEEFAGLRKMTQFLSHFRLHNNLPNIEVGGSNTRVYTGADRMMVFDHIIRTMRFLRVTLWTASNV